MKGRIDRETLRARYRQLAKASGLSDAHRILDAFEEAVWSAEPPLFHDEIRLAYHSRDEAAQPCDTLLLLVGHSPEPLILSVAYHCPRRVVFLHPQQGKVVERLARLWRFSRALAGSISSDDEPAAELKALAAADLDSMDSQAVGSPVRGVPFDDRDPAALFEKLSMEVRRERAHGASRIVLDITGAKKSMVASAVVAAGHEDIDTSYVDFENEFDPTLRRPKPASSRPGPFLNPFRALALRDRGLLMALFDQRRYGAAFDLARRLAEQARQPDMREILGESRAEERGQGFDRVASVADAYRAWQEGFYADAARLTASQARLPSTVAALAVGWPLEDDDAETVKTKIDERVILAEPTRPLAYFVDVASWSLSRGAEPRLPTCVLAAPGGESRRTFLRIYGAVESFICFTCHAFFADLRIIDPTPYEDRAREVGMRLKPDCTFPGWSAFLHEIVGSWLLTNSGQALTALKGSPREFRPRQEDLRLGRWFTKASRKAFAASAPPLVKYQIAGGPLGGSEYDELDEGNADQPGLSRFRDLRHKATHWMAPVPPDEAAGCREYFRAVVRVLLPLIDMKRGPFRGAAADFASALKAFAEGKDGALESYGPRSYEELFGKE